MKEKKSALIIGTDRIPETEITPKTGIISEDGSISEKLDNLQSTVALPNQDTIDPALIPSQTRIEPKSTTLKILKDAFPEIDPQQMNNALPEIDDPTAKTNVDIIDRSIQSPLPITTNAPKPESTEAIQTTKSNKLIQKIKKIATLITTTPPTNAPQFHIQILSRLANQVLTTNKKSNQTQEMILLSTNNYLGLANREEIIDMANQAAKNFGILTAGMPSLNGPTPLYEQLEQKLAKWCEFDETLLFAVDDIANAEIISTLTGKDDVILIDRSLPSAFIDGALQSGANIKLFSHTDIAMLEAHLQSLNPEQGKLVVINGVDQMTAEPTELNKIIKLKQEHPFMLVLDDSNAIGVIGNQGKGSIPHHKINTKEIDLLISSFSKNFNGYGGFIAGNSLIIDYIRHTARKNIFSANLSPSSLAATLKAIEILESEGNQLISRLKANTLILREAFSHLGLEIEGQNDIPIIPIKIGNESQLNQLFDNLIANNLYLERITPPDVLEKNCQLQIKVSAAHTKEDLIRIISVIQEIFCKFNLIHRETIDINTIIDHHINKIILSKIEEKSFRKNKNDYTLEGISKKLDWLSQKLNVKVSYINKFVDNPVQYTNNIETLIGAASIPLGIAGPIEINGEYANGQFYIPFATTEKALVNAYTRGMTAINKAGGADVLLHEDEIFTSPIFFFDTLKQSDQFTHWINLNFNAIKNAAESLTSHGKLEKISPQIIANKVILTFVYTTGDAMGLNMINFATREACRYILDQYPVKKYYLRSNFESDKKVSASHLINTYGKNVSASVILPRKIIQRYLNSTPEEMLHFYHTSLLGTIQKGMIGSNGQFANALAAIFIACGQDVASIVNSSIGLGVVELTESGDLYCAVKVPNLVIGTIGGGTNLPTQKEALELMGCYGVNKVKKLAEIITATLLAGEISLCSAFAKDTYINAHKITKENPLQTE